MAHIEGIKRMIDRQQEEGKKEEALKKRELEGLFSERARVRILVFGKVQGVFFCDYTKREADTLDLTGWVKNRDDGSVEIVAEGEKNKLRRLVIAAKKGSPLSKVEDVEYDYSMYTGKFDSFYVNY